MGRKGPLPRPDSIPTKQGKNTYHRATPSTSFDPAAIRLPATVACDAIAARFWSDHIQILIENKRIRPESAETFGLMCILYAEGQRLKEIVDQQGWTLTFAGRATVNPAVSQLHKIRIQYVNLAKEFGMTAAAEARIPMEPDSGEKEVNPLKAFGITG